MTAAEAQMGPLIATEVERFASSASGRCDLSPSYLAVAAAAQAQRAVAELATMLHKAAHQYITTSCIPPFWQRVASLEGAHAELVDLLTQLAAVVESCRRLIKVTVDYLKTQNLADRPREKAAIKSLERHFGVSVAASLYATMPPGFPELLVSFFQTALVSMSAESGAALGEPPEDAVLMPHAADTVHAASRALTILGMGDMVDELASRVVGRHLKEQLASTTEASDVSVLQPALQYCETVPLQFLDLVLPQGAARQASLDQCRSQLQLYVYEAVGSLRAAAMFDLVIDFPDSLPALEDLKECLRHTKAHRQLVLVFGSAIRARLLHPGAATTDIIQHYISTIRALHFVEPSGAVLEAVSAPLREYLRTRKDAIRCIVTMLTDDGDDAAGMSFLAELTSGELEVGGGARTGQDVDFDGPDADEKALLEVDEWEPGPLEVAPLQTSRAPPPASDVISLLVNIYGTKELFVSEYRSMLAERLLAKTDFESDRELRTLELLKVRFGEAALNAPEVMLRDLADSKRINSNVRTIANTATPLKAFQDLVPLDGLGVTIISQLFWPQLQFEEFKLPRGVQAMLSTFGRKYHAIKAPRVLQWKPSLGTVSLTLTIGDKDLEYNVSPIHATLLLHFQDRPEWAAPELADVTGVEVDLLRRKMVFWINQGVVCEERGPDGGVTYRRNEELQSPVGVPGDGEGGGDGLEDGRKVDDADAMAQFEPFVMGMLTNFDSLPLDRIHNMLKMFVVDPPYDRTMEQLSAFMAKLSTEDKVMLEGNVYKRRT